MIKKALVTGAAGFIGAHVVADLLKNTDASVRALIRPGEDESNLDGMDVEKVYGDILDKDSVNKAMKGIDTLFHLAAVYAIWMPDYRPLFEINIQGSRNILWAARDNNVKKVVYTSSIAALGVHKGKTSSDENTLFNQYGLCHPYVLSKYLSQQEALDFAEKGLDLVVVNPAFPFGEKDRVPTPTGKMIIDIVSGLSRMKFTGGINIVDVKDVARGHVLAAQKGISGEKYILGNKNVTMADLNRLICRAAGIKQKRALKIPIRPLKAGAGLMTIWSDYISHKPPLATPQNIEYASNHLFVDNTKAQKELGLKLSPVEKSLVKSINWFRNNGFLK